MGNSTAEQTKRIRDLCEYLPRLTNHQLDYVELVLKQFTKPYLETYLKEDSDFMDRCVLQNLGDAIKIHHCFSNGPFTKDKFEYAIHAVLNFCGRNSTLAPNGYPGYDIIINNHKVSLKTEAETGIRKEKIHISKLMELGKGTWQIDLLMNQFYKNLDTYDRILTLRCLSKKPSLLHYELIEIPKSLLIEASSGSIRVMETSKQPLKPAYCDVFDDLGNLKFQLYFDGGGERKLQVKNILTKYCSIQAVWKFSID